MSDYIQQGVEAIENVANKVIKQHFEKMANVNIAYRFIDEARESKGRVILAEPKKIPKLWQTFAEEYDFVLVVAEDYWTKFDNKKREAMIHEALLQVDLEPQGAAMGYPKQIGKELYELSNGDQVKGMREAYRKQEKLADYKVNLLAYNEEIISQSMKAYGCWREGLKKLKQSFVQMKLVDDDNKQNLRAVK